MIDRIIKQISKPIYGDCFKDILDLHWSKTDQDDDKKEHENDNDTLYAIHHENRTYFINDQIQDKLKVDKQYLFMYKDPKMVKSDIKSRNIPITLRFLQSKHQWF